RRHDERAELFVDATRMSEQALGPVQANDRRGSDPVDDLDRSVVAVLADPAIHAGLPQRVGSPERIALGQRVLERLDRSGRALGDVGAHSLPTRRAMRSQASSLSSRLVAWPAPPYPPSVGTHMTVY